MATLNLGVFSGSTASVIGYSTTNDTFYSSTDSGKVLVAGQSGNTLDLSPDAANGYVTDINYSGTEGWTIFGAKNVTNLELGDGADRVDYNYATSTGYTNINMGKGNDSVFMHSAQGNINIVTGAGNDYVDVSLASAGPTNIDVGDGDDSVFLHNSADKEITVNAGAGNDYVDVSLTSGSDVNIDVGDGNDSVFIHGAVGKTTISAGDGKDYIDILTDVGDNLSVDLGAGADSLFVRAVNGDLVVTGSGTAANYVDLMGNVEGTVAIRLGDGNDTLLTDATLTGTIDMGDGNNLINEGAKKHNPDFNEAVVTTGAGRDSVFATKVIKSAINTGAGNDTIHFDGDVKNSTINLGDGNDSLVIYDDEEEAGVFEDNIIYGGNGNDIVSINMAGDGNQLDLGEGNDSLFIGSVFSGTMTVTAGTGKDTLDFTSMSGGTVTLANLDIYNDLLRIDMPLSYGSHSSDGSISVGSGAGVVKVSETNGFYAARIDTGDDLAIGGWGNENGSLIDASSITDKVVLLGTANENAVDTLIGGSKGDEIVAGAGDIAYGGAGNDAILLNASLSATATGTDIEDVLKGRATATALNTTEYVGLASAGGKDTVLAFEARTSSFEGDVVYLFDNNISALDLSVSNNTDLVAKVGGATLTLASITGGAAVTSDVMVNVRDNTGVTYAVDYVKGTASVADTEDMANIYYSSGSSAMVDFGKFDDDLVVDLGNTGIMNNTGGAYYYGKFASVKGGSSANILMGSAAEKETLIAGSGDTTLWGGGSSADVLYGNKSSDSNVTYYFMAGDGKDTIDNGDWGSADDDDVIRLDFSSFSHIKNNGTDTTIYLIGSGDKLTLKDFGKSSTDTAVKFTFDGSSTTKVKIGVSGTSNTWTYDEEVATYMGGKNNTLKVGSDVDTAEIWLDGGGNNFYYESVKTVDASANSGTLILAGTDANESLMAGKGETSLWGGAGASNDTLKGASGGSTTFFFGVGDGSDVITSSYSDDKVVLYNVTIDDVMAGKVGIDTSKSGAMTITLKDGDNVSTLNLNGMSSSSVSTFQLGDGSTWHYDYSKKSWSD